MQHGTVPGWEEEAARINELKQILNKNWELSDNNVTKSIKWNYRCFASTTEPC